MAHETEGPLVQAATFCDRVIQGTDGTYSVIRIFDAWTVMSSGPSAPEVMPPADMHLFYFLSVKAGAARGRFNLRFVLESPDGLRVQQGAVDVNFTGDPAAGHTHVMEFALRVEQEGLYWLDVEQATPGVEGLVRLLARSPLRVIYQRQ